MCFYFCYFFRKYATVYLRIGSYAPGDMFHISINTLIDCASKLFTVIFNVWKWLKILRTQMAPMMPWILRLHHFRDCKEPKRSESNTCLLNQLKVESCTNKKIRKNAENWRAYIVCYLLHTQISTNWPSCYNARKLHPDVKCSSTPPVVKASTERESTEKLRAELVTWNSDMPTVRWELYSLQTQHYIFYTCNEHLNMKSFFYMNFLSIACPIATF